MSQPKIPVFEPLIEPEELAACDEALRLGWLGMGSYVGSFEQAVGQFLELSDRHVVAVSTGHAALHLSLLLASVGPQDEVITPSFNNAADFQAILATGARPVFCDIEIDSLCIDLEKAEKLISEKTKAMIVMDYACTLCDHDRIAEIADKYRLRIVHDAAHSFGSKYKGRMVGNFSDIAIFSFDPVKTVTCIDGGAVVVRSQEDVDRLHAMRLLGMSQSANVMYQNSRAWSYDIQGVGYRYHMANLHAALGLSQLKKIDEIIANRRRYCRYYNQGLADIQAVQTPQTDFGDIAPFLYYIRVPASLRDALRDYLSEAGVDTGIHWQPGHTFSLLNDCRRGDLSVTEDVGREILSLPLHSKMQTADLDRIVGSIREFFRGFETKGQLQGKL